MDPFISQLGALCKTHVTRNKWVFVPSHAVGRTIGERIALEGTNWLNLRFVTPLDIALRMGAPFLVERGTDPSEEGLGPALIMRLLLDLPVPGLPRRSASARRPGYFRPLADQPTMAEALWTTVRELRMAGLMAADLKAEAFESQAKHEELCALLGAYERFLENNNRGDMAAVYSEAMQHQDWCPIQPDDCWTELPGTVWTPLERRLIDTMPGERILPRALQIANGTVPRRLAEAKVEWVVPDAATQPLAFVLNPGSLGEHAGAPSHPPRTSGEAPGTLSEGARTINSAQSAIALFHAGGREAEIEEVIRRILKSGVTLDQVEIACASDAHVALVWEKALRHQWAVTLGPGIPASSSRPGRALIGFCDWVETDFSAGHLRRLLQSGDMGIEEEDEGFTASQAARTLGRAEAGWGRATYALSLGLLEKSYEVRSKDPDLANDEREAAQKKAEQVARIARWITRIIDGIPEESRKGKVPLQAVVTVALEFLENSTSRASQLDHRSATALGDYVKELRALDAFECSLGEALRFIRERVESLLVAAERPRPGHLYACRLQQAGYSGRPHLYIVGLEEGRVFPAASEDPVLLDAEREGISDALRRSADRIDEAVYGVLSRLATVGAQVRKPAGSVAQGFSPASPVVTFSYSVRDTRIPGNVCLLADVAGVPSPVRGSRGRMAPTNRSTANCARITSPNNGFVIASTRRWAWNNGGGTTTRCVFTRA